MEQPAVSRSRPGSTIHSKESDGSCLGTEGFKDGISALVYSRKSAGAMDPSLATFALASRIKAASTHWHRYGWRTGQIQSRCTTVPRCLGSSSSGSQRPIATQSLQLRVSTNRWAWNSLACVYCRLLTAETSAPLVLGSQSLMAFFELRS